MKILDYHQGINYSGYRAGQSPREEIYPNKTEIFEDLEILEGKYQYIRLFDMSVHALQVLELIRDNDLNFKVMLGLSLYAEENHEHHPFYPPYHEKDLEANKMKNDILIQEMIDLALKFRDIVFSISIGNEVRSIWSNSRISIQRLIETAKILKTTTQIPITYCEEYETWIRELSPLASTLDFISMHSYPVWQGYDIDQGLERLKENYQEVRDKYPDKDIVITETGWPTSSHGARIKKDIATTSNQQRYIKDVTSWSIKNKVIVFIFEAFDEPWKGGDDPLEPEKNWGLYNINRQKK